MRKIGGEWEFLVLVVVEFGFGGFGDCASAVAEPEEGSGSVLAGAGLLEEVSQTMR